MNIFRRTLFIGPFALRRLRMNENKLENEFKQRAKISTSSNKKSNFVLKTPKGTRDISPQMMAIRNNVFNKIRQCFLNHAAEEIDTPVFEMKETLTGKYGDDSKLIYDLADQGGENLSLRYDLTVPFARYLAMNKLDKMKRFHIAKVYRRDNPAMGRGRYREFYQCDFDIAGSQYDSMLPDAEVVQVTCEILESLDIGNFKIKINHRKIIDGMMEICGVPEDKIRTICSSIDKLDKVSWDEAYKEMTEIKGLSSEIALKIKELVELNGGIEVLDRLKNLHEINNSKILNDGIDEMKLFNKYASILDIEKYLIYDMSLVRGLDYYTGPIYEAVFEGVTEEMKKLSNEISFLGSIAAGGRYDTLVGMFDKKNKCVPCVGVSIGVERIFAIMELRNKISQQPLRSKNTLVFVASVNKGLTDQKLSIVKELWKSGIPAEFSYKSNAKLLNQLQYCEENLIPYAILIGEDELSHGLVKIRNIQTRSETIIDRATYLNEITRIISNI